MKVKDITILSFLVSVLFVQEQVFVFIPNVQLSTFLIILYTRLLSFKKVSLIITVHVLLDNLWMGSLSILYTPSMFIGWMLIPLLLNTIFKKLKSVTGLALFGFFYGFIYGWIFIPATLLLTGIPFIPYLISDIPFEIFMAICNFLAILWLYSPLYNILNHYLVEPNK